MIRFATTRRMLWWRGWHVVAIHVHPFFVCLCRAVDNWADRGGPALDLVCWSAEKAWWRYAKSRDLARLLGPPVCWGVCVDSGGRRRISAEHVAVPHPCQTGAFPVWSSLARRGVSLGR